MLCLSMRGGMEMRTGAADGSAVVMQMRMCIDKAKRSRFVRTIRSDGYSKLKT